MTYDITHGAVVNHRGAQWILGPEDLAGIVAQARSATRTWAAGRKSLEGALENRVAGRYQDRHARLPDATWLKDLKKQPDFKAIVEGLWPRLTAKKVLRRLYRDTSYRHDVCADLLTPEETELLHGGQRPSAADVLLLDEIESHLTRLPSDKTYGHIVIGEAQDLSPMQCRAIARRSPSGSLTVLGDLAQGTTPWAALDWRTQMHHLGHADAMFTELTVGFRVPAIVLELADQLLPHLGVGVSPARSIRSDGSVEMIRGTDLATATLDAVAKAMVEEGMVGVIAPEAALETLRSALPTSDRLALIPAGLAKGGIRPRHPRRTSRLPRVGSRRGRSSAAHRTTTPLRRADPGRLEAHRRPHRASPDRTRHAFDIMRSAPHHNPTGRHRPPEQSDA